MKQIHIKYNAAYAQFDDIPSELRTRIRSQLTYIDNQLEYQNKYSKRYINPEVCLLKGNTFYTGLLPRVDWIIRNSEYDATYTSEVTSSIIANVELPDWLYTHQLDMIYAAKEYKRGVLQCPTGGGKTNTMAYFIKHFPTDNILVTVPNKGLLKQTVTVLENILQETVGVIGDGKKDWGRVTVGIINSLSVLAQNEPNLFKDIKVYLADEVHRVGSNWYIPLCEALINTDYRIGLSATAWREKGDDKVLEGLIGPVILTVKEDYLINNKILIQPYYYYLEKKTPDYQYPGYNARTGMYDLPNNLPNRNDVVDKCIVKNTNRNRLIVNLGINYLKSNNILPGIILVEMIEHGEVLSNLFKELGYDVPFVYGKSSKKIREEFINKLKTCELKLGIASKILNEGIDVPSLGFGIIAGGGSNESKFIQQVGRFVRRYDGKDKAIIIDIHDTEPYYLDRNSQKRLKFFKSKYNTKPQKVNSQQLEVFINEQFRTV